MRGAAFGMELAAGVAIAGLPEAGGPMGGPRVSIELRPDEPPGADEGTPLLRRVAPDGTLHASIHHHDRRGYRIRFAGYGTYDIAGDGSSIVCRPPPELAPWEWQQCLFAQALPFAAVLNGFEPLHASGVVLAGRVIALAGGSGAGKSSIALELASRGARFFTDDVLAISRLGDETICHGGPLLANVRDERLRLRAERGLPPFAGVVGATAESARALVAGGSGSLPLGALYFLERSARHRGVRFESKVDPLLLLGSTFNAVIGTPERLARQLDACAHLAASGRAFRVTAPDSLPAAGLAAEIERHARRGSAPAPRPASAPCAPGRRAIPG
jgi:hypothetical protein